MISWPPRFLTPLTCRARENNFLWSPSSGLSFLWRSRKKGVNAPIQSAMTGQTLPFLVLVLVLLFVETIVLGGSEESEDLDTGM